jgi:hypothetical protein
MKVIPRVLLSQYAGHFFIPKSRQFYDFGKLYAVIENPLLKLTSEFQYRSD